MGDEPVPIGAARSDLTGADNEACSAEDNITFPDRSTATCVTYEEESVTCCSAQSATFSSLQTCPTYDEPSVTCRSAQSDRRASLRIVRENRRRCGLWACPIDADADRSVTAECIICLQTVNPNSFLSCTTCKQSSCIYCHLKSLGGKDYFCKHVAKMGGAGCSFCRTAYTMQQIRQLTLWYRGHRRELHFGLWAPHPLLQQRPESPDQPSEQFHCEIVNVNGRVDWAPTISLHSMHSDSMWSGESSVSEINMGRESNMGGRHYLRPHTPFPDWSPASLIDGRSSYITAREIQSSYDVSFDPFYRILGELQRSGSDISTPDFLSANSSFFASVQSSIGTASRTCRSASSETVALGNTGVDSTTDLSESKHTIPNIY